MGVRAQDGVEEPVVQGGDVAPGGKSVTRFHLPGGFIHQFEGSAFSCPGVGQGVDDEHTVVAGVGRTNGFDIVFGVKGVEFQNVEVKLIGVFAGRPSFGVDQGDGTGVQVLGQM